jgi:hypothetical protein
VLPFALALLLQTPATEAATSFPEARWKRVPSIYERALAYPSFTSDRRVAGRATLRRRITKIGTAAACSIYAETPEGHGFGQALMSLRSKMSFHQPKPQEGPWVLLSMSFDPDPNKGLYIH